jgi:hypothetical protein
MNSEVTRPLGYLLRARLAPAERTFLLGSKDTRNLMLNNTRYSPQSYTINMEKVRGNQTSVNR